MTDNEAKQGLYTDAERLNWAFSNRARLQFLAKKYTWDGADAEIIRCALDLEMLAADIDFLPDAYDA